MRWFTLTFLEGVSQMQLSGLSHPEGSSCRSQSILLEPGIPTPPTPLLLVSQYSYPALPPLEMVALHALGKLIQNVPGLHFLVRTASTRQVSYAVPRAPIPAPHSSELHQSRRRDSRCPPAGCPSSNRGHELRYQPWLSFFLALGLR